METWIQTNWSWRTPLNWSVMTLDITYYDNIFAKTRTPLLTGTYFWVSTVMKFHYNVIRLYNLPLALCLYNSFLSLSPPSFLLQTAYYLKVFPAVYQWTSSYHFVVRLYSQQTVICMWDDFSKSDLTEVFNHFRMLETTIDFMKKTGWGVTGTGG